MFGGGGGAAPLPLIFLSGTGADKGDGVGFCWCEGVGFCWCEGGATGADFFAFLGAGASGADNVGDFDRVMGPVFGGALGGTLLLGDFERGLAPTFGMPIGGTAGT